MGEIMNIQKINDNIYRTTLPYKDIFTTVYLLKTEKGVLLFDIGSYDEDIENYILPFLDELEITEDMIKYVFISHNHTDHSGGLSAFMKRFPNTIIVSRCSRLKKQYANYNVLVPDDNDCILDVLRIVTIPGHTEDSNAIYDTRTRKLISGDSLQLYGIYGSGKWGSNIKFPKEHIAAIGKLQKMDIQHILTAHDYHPFGYSYEGKDEVLKALYACVSPLNEIKDLIIQNPDIDDGKICEIYNTSGNPTLGVHVVTAVRKML